ncbi:MAG: type 4a pilus biogenesis protein PilO [Candidatus Levybacteria bacterium]|nr:type 4a pilus biogenesis protein PilO [Candidatus Levybacteria bacterium]
MKLPKSYFENLSAAKYREYLKLLPSMEQENTTIFVAIALTLAALSFFGIFAINPTLTTIAELQKELADNEAVEEQLTTKINNLSSLQQQYNVLEKDLPIIYAAIPTSADAPLLSAQVEALAQQNNVTISTFRVAEVQLASNQPSTKTLSYIFTLQAEGAYQNMIDFSASLSRLSRVITVESMSIGRDTKTNDLILTLRGRQYFKP